MPAITEEIISYFQNNDRFWSRVKKTDKCWFWMGAIHYTGYGSVFAPVNGRQMTFITHRVAWALTHGPIPDRALILHKLHCSNTACCRPDHLYLGTHRENSRDTVLAKRNPGRINRKLFPEELALIRCDVLSGMQPKQLSDKYGITRDLARDILHGRAYKL